ETIANNLPWLDSPSPQEPAAAATTPGKSEPARWVAVVVNVGPGEAVIIKGRLQSEDIPALVQQEAVGAVLGLTVGPLGSARVLVPEPLAERALAILAETFEPLDDDDDS
ncbi:MAG: DUF2007 domain-containing protein, partial [Chloroflexota bacterium]